MPLGDVAGGVGVRLERNLAAAADAFVGGDDAGRGAVGDAAGERIRREAAEHHRMDGADAGAGEHRDRRLQDHRHVDGDAVALLDAARLQHVGEAADLGVQLLIGELLVGLGVVAFPQERGLVAALGEMAVDAIVAGVERAVLEPFDRDVVRIVGGVLHLGEGLDPVDALGLLAPELGRVLHRGGVHFLVLGVVHIGALLPIGGNVIDLIGHLNLPPCPRYNCGVNWVPPLAPIMRRRSGAGQGAECAPFVGVLALSLPACGEGGRARSARTGGDACSDVTPPRPASPGDPPLSGEG